MLEEFQTPEPFSHELTDPSRHTEDIQYTTSINQLIAEADAPSKTQLFLASLYYLSHYLFQKKTNSKQQEEISFNDYLRKVSDEFSIYDTMHKKSVVEARNAILGLKKGEQQKQYELVECYKRVPYLYFKEQFVLDFGELSKSAAEIRERQERLNEDLDLVEINLFAQIHCKFHEYFKVVANFDYLSESLVINIAKISEARTRIHTVKSQFVDKSAALRHKLNQRKNYQHTIKLMKITKSLRKLPIIINQILSSSLPYQCLSLIKSTKDSLCEVQHLRSLTKTSQMIKESQALVQVGLNKRYADQLYTYLEECQNTNLHEHWERISTYGCMDLSLNNSALSAGGMSNSNILEESFMDMQPSCSVKRNQGKEFQIAMIILESYKFVDFPVQLVRIKISNSLRIYSKTFDSCLAQSLSKLLEDKGKKGPSGASLVMSTDGPPVMSTDGPPVMSTDAPPVKGNEISSCQNQESVGHTEQVSLTYELVEKVTAIFYVKHLFIFNEVMKQTMDRFLGYIQTLLMEYQLTERTSQDEKKFTNLFKEELTILPAMCKINIDKLKSLMSMKNISGVSLQVFKQWMGLLEYWEKYTQMIFEEFPFLSYEGSILGIQDAINNTFKKMMGVMNIRQQINELTIGFVNSYHDNVVNCEFEQSFAEESWQPITIPSELLEILNNISIANEANTSNMSITILNESGEFNANKSLSMSCEAKKVSSRFKVMKNNVLVDGTRFKISTSFLLLCECIDEYVRMGNEIVYCRKFIYERMLDLIEMYHCRARELILEAKARKYEKMKDKSISAKNICLLHNCLSLLLKLLGEFRQPEIHDYRKSVEASIDILRKKLIEKLSGLLKSKVQVAINKFLVNPESKVSQTNMVILNFLVQMLGIIDQFLDFEEKKTIFQESMNIFLTRYVKQLLLKGPELLAENRMLLEKLKIFRQYFPEELEVLEKELARIQR